MNVGWGWVLRLFAEGALVGQLRVNVFKLGSLLTGCFDRTANAEGDAS